MSLEKIELLITAEQAYPAYERAFLAARFDILMGFRIFDPNTRLYSPEGRSIGETWADLFVYTLNRGVDITLKISDFDPVAAADLHALTTRSVRRFEAIRKRLSPNAGRFIVGAHMHPARVGYVARLSLWPAARKKLLETCEQINEGALAFDDVPGIHAYVKKKNGRFEPRVEVLPKLYPVTHHHKCFVVDDTLACLGGIDVNERRYDDIKHKRTADETWHDVQILIKDKTIAASLRRHLEDFEESIRSVDLSEPGGLLRTLSIPRRHLCTLSPKTCLSQIKSAHLRNIENSEELIYLETQFFRDRDICDALVRRVEEIPDLKLVLVLPAAPEEIAFDEKEGVDQKFGEYLQAECVERIKRAFGENLIIASPVAPRPSQEDDRTTLSDSPIVYVHSKVSIFDEKSAIISSANLNTRSLEWDTEVGYEFSSEEVSTIKGAVWDAWWNENLRPDLNKKSDDVFRIWREGVISNGKVDPSKRSGFLVPYDVRPAKKMGLYLPFVPKGMV